MGESDSARQRICTLIFELALFVIDGVYVRRKNFFYVHHHQFHDVHLPLRIRLRHLCTGHLPTEINSLPDISLALSRCHLHAAQLQDAGEYDIIAAYTC